MKAANIKPTVSRTTIVRLAEIVSDDCKQVERDQYYIEDVAWIAQLNEISELALQSFDKGKEA